MTYQTFISGKHIFSLLKPDMHLLSIYFCLDNHHLTVDNMRDILPSQNINA